MKFFLVVFIVACLVNVALSANVSGLVGYNGVHALPGVVAQPESRISRLLPSFYYMMTMVVSIKSHLDGVSAANILQQHPHITVDVQGVLFKFVLATMAILIVQSTSQRPFTMNRVFGSVLAFAQMFMLFYFTKIARIDPLDDAENLILSGFSLIGLNLVVCILYILEQL